MLVSFHPWVVFFFLFTAVYNGELLCLHGFTNITLSAHRVFCFPDKKRNKHKKPALCPWVQFVEVKRRDFYCYVTQKWSSHVWHQFQKTGLPSCHLRVHSLQHPPPQNLRLPPDFPGRDDRLKLLQCQLRPRYLAASSFKMQSPKLSAGNAPRVCCQMSQCQLTLPQFILALLPWCWPYSLWYRHMSNSLCLHHSFET